MIWILGGLAAGALTLGVAEFLAGVMARFGWISGDASPVVSVGSTFIDHTPMWLKNWAISVFSTHDKQALLAGMAIVITLACAGIGWLLRRRADLALPMFAVLGAVGAACVLTRPDAGALNVVPTVVGVLLGLVALREFRSRALAFTGSVGVEDQPASTALAGRRTLLLASAGSLLLGAAGAAAGRAVSAGRRSVEAARNAFVVPTVARPVTVPAGASVGVPGVTPFVVPQKEFYRIDTALVVPQVDVGSWRLKVHGMVEREVELDWEQLLAKPMQQAMVTLMCVSNEVGGDLNGNAIWTGWPVRELLKEAGVRSGADMVLSRSTDGFTAGTPLPALTDERNALIAVAMNGEALNAEHGFPARLVVPGLYGYVSATKWLTDLKVTTFAEDQGYWTPRGWSELGPVKTASRIDVPTQGKTVSAGTVAVAGVAWDQHTGIRAVQVRIDDGEWRPATLGTDATVDAWRQWVYRWKATSGSHRIAVRAQNAKGVWQTATEAPPAPNGSTGLHTITVTVD